MVGAFGVPHFLPTSYLRFGPDGNGDGHVSLQDPADAVASCARYLLIWTYNHATPYIDTVRQLPQP